MNRQPFLLLPALDGGYAALQVDGNFLPGLRPLARGGVGGSIGGLPWFAAMVERTPKRQKVASFYPVPPALFKKAAPFAEAQKPSDEVL